MSRKTIKYAALCASLLIATVFAGCGTENKEGETSAANVAKVGDSACFQCHAATSDPLTGDTFIAQYQRSVHAELGCESCHGGGAQHNGVGPFPYALNKEVSDAQKAERCAMCHNGVNAPLSSSPNFQNGNHANPFGAEEAHETKCARCHSHEGSILYGIAGFTGDASILNNTAYQPVLARDPETFNTIKCATCHEHGGNLRQFKTRDAAGNIVTWDPNKNFVNDQFDLCTSCHTVNTNDGRVIGSGNILSVAASATTFKNVTTAAYYHNTRWFRTLPSTHYDQPASPSPIGVEGYVIRKSGPNNQNPCYDCHGHEFKANTRAVADRPERGTTVFTDWAQSAHAGGLLKRKVAAATGLSGAAQVDAVMKAAVIDDKTGAAWVHYDWDDTASRGSCQKCHTSTGAANYFSDPNGYKLDGSGNNFQHLSGWTNSNKKSPQNELLYCWGCHSNAGKGTIRNPGAIQARYSASTYAKFTISYPDVAGSNICISCHAGREAGDSIKTNRNTSGTLAFVNSHYLAAGGQLFGTTGYEYAGRDYANPSYFKHDKIGSEAAPGTGSNGPCAGCHMTTANKHLFTNVTKSTAGVITAITSTACATCHAGQYALTAEKLATEEEEYQTSLTAAKAVLASKGIHFYEAHPYFYTAPYVVGGTNTGYTAWGSLYGSALWKDTMGAAFNINLLLHDPGGYAHNRIYSKRLIYDAIDFVSDGVLNNNVEAAINASSITTAQKEETIKYLVGAPGGSRP
jgi:hypothetical protein